MSQPKTLLEMAGAPLAPSRFSDSAVIMIDCQREYVDGKLPLPGVKPALAEGGRLLAKAREAGGRIVHVVHHGAPGGGVFDPENEFSSIAPEVAAEPGERQVVKDKPNAFADTELHDLLQELGAKELIVAGFMSHMCVSSTVRAALDLGYRCTLVDGAVATRDLPDGKGGVITADALHRATLAALADRFAIVVDNADALSA